MTSARCPTTICCGRSPDIDTSRRQALLAGAYAARFDITFGMGNSNPVERVFFYLRSDDAVGRVLKGSQVSTFVPRHFAESYVRLFLRDRDDSELFDVASSALQAWERAVLGRVESDIAQSPPHKPCCAAAAAAAASATYSFCPCARVPAPPLLPSGAPPGAPRRRRSRTCAGALVRVSGREADRVLTRASSPAPPRAPAPAPGPAQDACSSRLRAGPAAGPSPRAPRAGAGSGAGAVRSRCGSAATARARLPGPRRLRRDFATAAAAACGEGFFINCWCVATARPAPARRTQTRVRGTPGTLIAQRAPYRCRNPRERRPQNSMTCVRHQTQASSLCLGRRVDATCAKPARVRRPSSKRASRYGAARPLAARCTQNRASSHPRSSNGTWSIKLFALRPALPAPARPIVREDVAGIPSRESLADFRARSSMSSSASQGLTDPREPPRARIGTCCRP